MSINWFPGHMAKTLKDLQSVKGVDLVIEVVDARAINTSSNTELVKLFKQPKLVIALKSDLADIDAKSLPSNCLVGNIKSSGFKQVILKKIDELLASKISKLKAKGLLVPQFYILVVGLPNVGKSSLINYLSTKNQLRVENRPGVTRTRQIVKISNNYFLYDTPGVFLKKVENMTDGYKLGLVGCVKKEVLPLNEVLAWAYQYLIQHYLIALQKHYQFTNAMNYYDFINYLCQKYQFYLSKEKPDVARATQFFFMELTNGKIMKVNYEK